MFVVCLCASKAPVLYLSITRPPMSRRPAKVTESVVPPVVAAAPLQANAPPYAAHHHHGRPSGSDRAAHTRTGSSTCFIDGVRYRCSGGEWIVDAAHPSIMYEVVTPVSSSPSEAPRPPYVRTLVSVGVVVNGLSLRSFAVTEGGHYLTVRPVGGVAAPAVVAYSTQAAPVGHVFHDPFATSTDKLHASRHEASTTKHPRDQQHHPQQSPPSSPVHDASSVHTSEIVTSNAAPRTAPAKPPTRRHQKAAPPRADSPPRPSAGDAAANRSQALKRERGPAVNRSETAAPQRLPNGKFAASIAPPPPADTGVASTSTAPRREPRRPPASLDDVPFALRYADAIHALPKRATTRRLHPPKNVEVVATVAASSASKAPKVAGSKQTASPAAQNSAAAASAAAGLLSPVAAPPPPATVNQSRPSQPAGRSEAHSSRTRAITPRVAPPPAAQNWRSDSSGSVVTPTQSLSGRSSSVASSS